MQLWMSAGAAPRRVGIIGFGKVGQFLAESLPCGPRAQGLLELAFVCDPVALPHGAASPDWLPAACQAPPDLGAVLQDGCHGADLAVEVAHPSVSREWGETILRSADYYVASTTAFADAAAGAAMLREAERIGWGGV